MAVSATPIIYPTKEDDLELVQSLFSGEEFWGLKPEKISKRVTPENQSLIREVYEAGLDASFIKHLVGYCTAMDSLSNVDIRNALLIAGEIISHGDKALLQGSNQVNSLVDIVVGMYQTTKERRLNQTLPIATVEELTSRTSVASFILQSSMRGEGTKSLVRGGYKTHNGKKIQSFVLIRNRHLDRLLSERPEDMRFITAYVHERGIHPANKRPVDTIRAYLDGTRSVIAVKDGWL